jgi:type VI secretion system protein ImpB
MGVLADLSGQPEEALPRMANRRFVEINRDNFNEVMAGMKPRLAFRVDNQLTDDDSKLGVELRFNHMDDFSPERVAEQVEPLRKLMQIRQQLSGLLAKTDGNDALSERLQEIITNTEELQQIRDEAGLGEAMGDGASSAEEKPNE